MYDLHFTVKAFFPYASDWEADEILFAKTGYPAFFRSNDPLMELIGQLALYAEACRLGLSVCYCCGKMKLRSEMDDDDMFCKRGRWMMRQVGGRRHGSRAVEGGQDELGPGPVA